MLRYPLAGRRCAWLVVLARRRSGRRDGSRRCSVEHVQVPGTDSERARTILEQHSATAATARSRSSSASPTRAIRQLRARLQRRARPRRARGADRHGHAAASPPARTSSTATSISTLDLAEAKGYTDDLLHALGQPPGLEAYVTGAAAIQHDLDPIFNEDLRKGESIALPIALLVLLARLRPLVGGDDPVPVRGLHDLGTLGLVYVVAHCMTMPTYVTNLVFS